MLALLLGLDLSTVPTATCAQPAVVAAVQAAGAALTRKDAPAAKAAIEPAARCPATSYPAFVAHVIRAQLAVGEDDWPAARAALDGVGVHPEAKLSALAGFLRLRVDQGLGDAAGFARDRAALISANDAMLAAAGRRVETFRSGSATVTGYIADIDQGPFRRTIEFIIVPDDASAYPAAVHLTDDRRTVTIASEIAAKKGEPPRQHVWFIDQYTCDRHATLAPAIAGDVPPSYADLKVRVTALAAQPELSATTQPTTHAACFAAQWILPGLGSK